MYMTKITCVYNTLLNFSSVSFCTAYIIFTFRAIWLVSVLELGFRVRVELYFGTDRSVSVSMTLSDLERRDAGVKCFCRLFVNYSHTE